MQPKIKKSGSFNIQTIGDIEPDHIKYYGAANRDTRVDKLTIRPSERPFRIYGTICRLGHLIL